MNDVSTKLSFKQNFYERALLSYCFKRLDNYYMISIFITANDFLDDEHRLIWMIFDGLVKKRIKHLDVYLVIDEARKNNILTEQLHNYILALADMDLSSINLDFCIKVVLDASAKYKLYTNLNSNLKLVKEAAVNDDFKAADLIGKVSKELLELSLSSKAIKEAKNLADGIDEYLKERYENEVEFCGISTGLPILDKRIDGLVPGTLTVLCARPKHGKSTFLSNIAAYVAYELRKPVLYVDTEMDFDQWRSRILAMLSNVPERKIKHGGYTEEEYGRLKLAASIIKKGKLFHEFMPGYSLDKLTALYNKYKHIENIELAIFDYIKAPSRADFKNKKEYQILGDVTTTLKDLAGELEIPFLCANQINRQNDIADSDRILRYSDVVMFFKPKTKEEFDKVHPFEKDYGNYKLVITDSRRGGTTPDEGIGYYFLKRLLKIEEAPKQLIDYDNYVSKEKDEIMFVEDESSIEEVFEESVNNVSKDEEQLF